MLGDSGVGKSSIIDRLINGKFDENLGVSMSIDMKKKELEIDNYSILLQLWDTAGNESFKSIIRSVYLETSIAFIVYDVTKANSFEKVQFWLEEARHSLREDCLYILIANKIDLGNVITEEEGLDFMKKNNIDLFYEISTKTGENFDNTFKQIVSRFAKDTIDSRNIKESIKLLKESNRDLNQKIDDTESGYSYCST